MIGRLRRSTEFERTLGTRPCARSDHFALHHLSAESLQADLSTGSSEIEAKVVDEFTPRPLSLGAVVPKRHARRAVTRNLIKRQIRSAAERHARQLAPGWWVVRLKAPFDAEPRGSAASQGIRRGARAELDALLAGSCKARSAS